MTLNEARNLLDGLMQNKAYDPKMTLEDGKILLKRIINDKKDKKK